MATYAQANRLLTIATPLGPDALLLHGLEGREAFSELFQFDLELLSENASIAPRDLLGQPVTWAVNNVHRKPRYWNGHIQEWAAGGQGARGLRSYRARVVPWLWFLTRTSNCRIFQNKSTPEILEAVFKEFGFAAFSFALTRSYPPWEFCVQYRETAFHFVSRLMEHEGIFYFFRHEQGKHTLVLADHKGVYQDCPESKVDYRAGSLAPNHIDTWEHRYAFGSGKWAQSDYNFETPSASLLTTATTVIDLPDLKKYERFQFPGEYRTRGEGEADIRVHMEQEEAGYDVTAGSSQCCTFTPGGKFKLGAHEVASEMGKEYVLTAVRHSARDPSLGNTAEAASYRNQFTCIPARVVYRPACLTHRPVIDSVQTAVVVGPAGEEIYTDQYGRIKVQFFWDRYGKRNENSSCWLRVSQFAAGKNFGALNLPRVGQEVIVAFAEGNPDRPLVLGSLYNAENMPPYPLPRYRDFTGMIHRSVRGVPGNSSEIRFETTLGKERLLVHSETDMHTHAENDSQLRVGNDHRCLVGNECHQSIGKDHHHRVAHNYYLTVGSGGFSWEGGSAGSDGAASGSGMGGGDAPAPAVSDPSATYQPPPALANTSVWAPTESEAPQDWGIGTFQINASNVLTIVKIMDNKLVLGFSSLFVAGANVQAVLGANIQTYTPLNMTMTLGANIEMNCGTKKELTYPEPKTVIAPVYSLATTQIYLLGMASLVLECGLSTTVMLTPAAITLQCGPTTLVVSPAGVLVNGALLNHN
jgi:type VI secretion system secreted protein VgrG